MTLVVLLVATAAAFAVTERLKLTKSALMPGTKVSRAFSPTCGCHRSRANIKVVLRRADTVSVDIVRPDRSEVVPVVAAERLPRGAARFRWDGRGLDGKLEPDGAYKVKIHFTSQHQTIVLPNEIQLDTTLPQVEDAAADPGVFSPDGDKQADITRLRWTFSKPAHAAFYLDGRRFLYTHKHPQRGSTTWDGRVHDRLLPPGTYTIEVGATDAAGNRTPAAQRVRIQVRIRYIVLATRHLRARPRGRLQVGVSTDARRYDWTLGGRRGRGSGSVLTLRAPAKPGRYVLTVSEHGHGDRAQVVVAR